MPDFVNIALGIAIAVLIFLPPKYDPAIRLKEWLERKGKP